MFVCTKQMTSGDRVDKGRANWRKGIWAHKAEFLLRLLDREPIVMLCPFMIKTKRKQILKMDLCSCSKQKKKNTRAEIALC